MFCLFFLEFLWNKEIHTKLKNLHKHIVCIFLESENIYNMRKFSLFYANIYCIALVVWNIIVQIFWMQKSYRLRAKASFILNVSKLSRWAITLPTQNGCFQAYLKRVNALWYWSRKLLFPRSSLFKTLSYFKGCFPFGFGPSHPKPVYLFNDSKKFSVFSDTQQLRPTRTQEYSKFYNFEQMLYLNTFRQKPAMHELD